MSLHLIECPVGCDHNAITHLATHSIFQKILSPDMHTVFMKYGNAPNTQKSYSLTMWSPLRLYNTSLDAKFSFSFGLTISLNWGKCPKYTKRSIINSRLASSL